MTVESLGVSNQEALFEVIAAALEKQGYVVLPDVLPGQLTDCLLRLRSEESLQFHAAGIGRGQAQMHNPELRRDSIAWIDDRHPLSGPWLKWTSDLQSYLNRRLFLGLFSFESHLAFYRPGDFYKKHVDAFRGRSNRRLSLVAYLNEGWHEEEGGELVIYGADDESILARVSPKLGTLVLFLSEEFPHEVLPATRERLSVAGWFRINGSAADLADPPA